MDARIARVGAIGDIHCEDRRLESALAFLREQSVDRVLAVGDIVDGEGDPDRCCALLREHEALVVRGNHERWFLAGEMRDVAGWTTSVADETRAYLETLPATMELETVAGRLMLCHGVGDDDMATLTPDARGYAIQCAIDGIRHRDDVSIVVGGHTHRRMVRAIGQFLFLNPGTLLRGHEPGFMIADLAERRAVHYDVAEDGTITTSESVEVPLPARDGSF